MNERGVAVAEEQIRLTEKQLELAKARFESGTVARLDVLQAEVELANAKARRIQARAQVDTVDAGAAQRAVAAAVAAAASSQGRSTSRSSATRARSSTSELPQRPDLQAFTARRQAAEYSSNLAAGRVEAEPVVHRQHAIPAGLGRVAAGARQPELRVRHRS